MQHAATLAPTRLHHMLCISGKINLQYTGAGALLLPPHLQATEEVILCCAGILPTVAERSRHVAVVHSKAPWGSSGTEAACLLLLLLLLAAACSWLRQARCQQVM
jgi:hypothetical protein